MPNIQRVVLKKVLMSDMSFNGEKLASGYRTATMMTVYRVHQHSRPDHPSNRHAGKYILVIEKKEENPDKNKITYIHCEDPQEVVNALYQPTHDGGYFLSPLAQHVLEALVMREPDNFENTIKE